MTGHCDRVVLCFGDSNTHGTLPMAGPDQRDRLARNDRWPGVMAAALGTGWHVIEEGHPGRTSLHDDPLEGAHKNGLAVLPALLETHRPIDLVVIMLGTNDLKARFSVTAGDIARSLERLVGVVRASDAGPEGAAPDLVLVAPAPIREVGWLSDMFQGGAAKSRDLPMELAAVAERQGIGFLDAGLHANVAETEGIHLRRDGHRALGAAIARAVRGRFA